MEYLEKVFKIREIEPFDKLAFSELVNVVSVVKERFFNHKEIICKKGEILEGCYILLEKKVIPVLKNSSSFIGIKSALFNKPMRETITVNSEKGLWVFWIPRNHVFTIMEQCPEFIIGFFNMDVV